MRDELPRVEIEGLDTPSGPTAERMPVELSRDNPLIPVILVVLVLGAIGWLVLRSDDAPEAADEQIPEQDAEPASEQQSASVAAADRLEAVQIAESIPRPLLLAELFAANPSGARARDLFEELGGFEGATVAAADGAFDLVRFDPLDPNRLLATKRLSYGPAENQESNEVWVVDGDSVEQALWAPDTSHDFVHFNVDGTVTMWAHGGGDEGFAPRTAHLLTGDFGPMTSSEPVYPSRFTAAAGKVFALTGNGVYAADDPTYVDLIADDGVSQTVLTPAASLAWIDNPTPDLLIAYSRAPGLTMAWDTHSVEPLEDHPLSGRPYIRAAISESGSVALGVTFDGELEQLDLETGDVVKRFGAVDVAGIDQPITLSRDGSLAVTVEQSGTVTLWWVGDGTKVAATRADAGQPRWVAEDYAALSASAVAMDASRVALRISARPNIPLHWDIVDIDPDSWVLRACELAGRSLRDAERVAIGLPALGNACS